MSERAPRITIVYEDLEGLADSLHETVRFLDGVDLAGVSLPSSPTVQGAFQHWESKWDEKRENLRVNLVRLGDTSRQIAGSFRKCEADIKAELTK